MWNGKNQHQKNIKKNLDTARTYAAVKKAEEPKRLSKMAEFMKKHPGGVIEILDYKAVMK